MSWGRDDVRGSRRGLEAASREAFAVRCEWWRERERPRVTGRRERSPGRQGSHGCRREGCREGQRRRQRCLRGTGGRGQTPASAAGLCLAVGRRSSFNLPLHGNRKRGRAVVSKRPGRERESSDTNPRWTRGEHSSEIRSAHARQPAARLSVPCRDGEDAATMAAPLDRQPFRPASAGAEW